MSKKKCVTMILAGGRGERLGSLTRYYSKPAVHFGEKSRIIDYTMRNCENSGIDNIGILSQNFSDDLRDYIDTNYGSETGRDGICILPPRDNRNYYAGTATAVYKNIGFIDRLQPEYVLILAGDHIYRMDYSKMIGFHRSIGADLTIASTPVPIQEASRFGIINADESGRVFGFEEKPRFPKSRLASMGIYVFKWDKLKTYLLADNESRQTQHDFGRNILPEMRRAGELIYTYQFKGYWRDVGTVDSLWEANMDQIDRPHILQIPDDRHETDGINKSGMSYSANKSDIRKSVISGGCSVFGRVEHSVLYDQVTVGEGAEVIDSVIMPGAYIGSNARIYKAVVGTNAIIMDNAVIGGSMGSDLFVDNTICKGDVSLISPWLYIANGMRFLTGSHICQEHFHGLSIRESEAAGIHPKINAGCYIHLAHQA